MKRIAQYYSKPTLMSVRYLSQSNIFFQSNIDKPVTNSDALLQETRILLNKMTVEQRRAILVDLQIEDATLRKTVAEEKLASWNWRSQFGRPTSVFPSKVDPTGTYCEIPQDWLQKKVAENAKPTFSDLRKLAVFNALPFVGFGFLDNLIMIVAGDYIDTNIGIYLGISTMAAAALGNTVSDLAGIGSAWYVENIATKIGVRPPVLTQAQQGMRSTSFTANFGRALGVVIGCILGMFPLMFLPNKNNRIVSEESEKVVLSDLT